MPSGYPRTSADFWAELIPDGDCLVWPAVNHDGYGRLSFGGRVWLAHRLAMHLRDVPIPAGLEIDHLCRNRACANPDHLEIVTHTENMRRGTGMDRIHAAKTHCVHGHEFTTENTYIKPSGARQCRECHRVAYAAYKLRRSAGQQEAFRLRQEREAAADRVQRYFASIGHPDFFTRGRLLNIVSAVLAEPAQEF